MHIFVYTDGGSRGNPGDAAYGYVIADESGAVLAEDGAYMGQATNNEAEYTGLLEVLKFLQTWEKIAEVSGITFRLDSNLVVQQVQGSWKIKEPRLREFVAQIQSLLEKLNTPYAIEYVPREQNWMADAMVNQKLDAREDRPPRGKV